MNDENCLNCTFFAKKDKAESMGKCFCKDSKAYDCESPEDFASSMKCPFYINSRDHSMSAMNMDKVENAWNEMDQAGYLCEGDE